AVAVSAGGAEVTYGELEASSNQLAELLQEAGCGRGAVVGVVADESLSHITAMLGALKARAAFAPLDTRLPEVRLRGMLELIRPGCLLVEPGHLQRVAGLSERNISVGESNGEGMKVIVLQGVRVVEAVAERWPQLQLLEV